MESVSDLQAGELAGLANDIAKAVSLDDTSVMLRGCTDALVRNIGAAFARIWLVDDSAATLTLVASSGIYTHLDGAHSRVPIGKFKIGLIAEEKKPHLSNDVMRDPRVSDRDWAKREGMVAFAGHPLMVGDRLIGVMALFAKFPLTPAVLASLATIASTIAVAVERQKAQEALRMTDVLRGVQEQVRFKNEQLKVVNESLSIFIEKNDFGRASAHLLGAALRQTESEYGFVGVVVDIEPYGQVLRVFADEGFYWDPKDNRALYDKIRRDYAEQGYIDFPNLNNLFGRVILDKQALIANDPAGDPRRSGNRPKGHPPLESFLGVPILQGDSVVGMFGVANKKGGYTGVDLERIETLCQAAALLYDSYRRRTREVVLEKERGEAREQLEHTIADLQNLAYVVSHELQDPIVRIKSYLNLLRVRYADKLGPDAGEFMQICSKSADRINRMVDDLWTYARVYRSEAILLEVDTSSVVVSVIQGLHDLVKEVGGSVTHGALPRVRMSEKQVSYVLGALLENALRYRSTAPPRVHVSAEREGERWVFCVEDNGVGIDSIFFKDIFRLFFRLRPEMSPEGTGMGLSISKKIIEQNGGDMWVVSEVGRGSKFFFSLPVR
jgi:signal transduction histidine kinase